MVDTEPEAEYLESTTVKFEWTLKGLSELFDSRYASALFLGHISLEFALKPVTAKEKLNRK